MEHKILYAYSEEQLEKIFEKLLRKFSNNSLQSTPRKEIPKEDRLSQRAAALMLDITVQTLIKWKKKEIIPYYQIEGTIFYSKSELLDYAKNNPRQFNRL